MIITIFVTYMLVAILSIFENRINNYKLFAYISVAIILICIAGFRPIGIDKDSLNYEYDYNNIDDKIVKILVEPSFVIITKLTKFTFNNIHALLFIYAIIGVASKFIAIKRLSPILFLPILIYISNYFMLHEMTQIRAGIASGLLLILIKPLSEGKKVTATLLMILAIFFHYSSIILLPLLLLSNKPMTKNWRIMWAMIIPIGYIFHFMNIGLTSIPIPYISDKMDAYTEMRDRGVMGDEIIKIFNPLFVVKITIYLYLLWMYETICTFNKYLPLLMKISGISLFSFLFLADMPVFAFRVSELYGIVDIVLLSNIYYTFRPVLLSKITIIFIGMAFLLLNVFYSQLIEMQ